MSALRKTNVPRELTVKDLDCVFHSFRVKNSVMFIPVEKKRKTFRTDLHVVAETVFLEGVLQCSER